MWIDLILKLCGASQVELVVKNPPAKAKDLKPNTGSLLGSGRSHGGGHGSPPQYSCLGNPTDRRVWRGAAQGRTRQKQLSCTPAALCHSWEWCQAAHVLTTWCYRGWVERKRALEGDPGPHRLSDTVGQSPPCSRFLIHMVKKLS